MLILAREANEGIILSFGERRVRVVVTEVRGNKVKLGFEADREIVIDREEVDEAKRRNKAA